MSRFRRIAACLGALGTLVTLAACSSATAGTSGTIGVVAAENFWGSIAQQLGGGRVSVTSIVTDPNADPHDYESSAVDARRFASAKYVIVNGAGYDTWADRLLAAQPSSDRTVFTVAAMLGKKEGDNPHFWYDPAAVFRVIDRITADYSSIDPGDSAYFEAQHDALLQQLASYRTRLAYIEKHFSGARVASTESIFQYLAQYLHLDLVTPYAFMAAVAEGNDPPASTVATFEQQIRSSAFTVLVYNAQTVTPLTSTIKEESAAKDIPAVAVTETIQPPIDTFEEWMDGQLDALTNALNAQALGR